MEADNRAQFNAGIVAAAVYNCAPFGDEKRQAVNPVEFVPAWNSRKNKSNDMTDWAPEEQREYLLKVFDSTGNLVRKDK